MPHTFFLGYYTFRTYAIHAQYKQMFPSHTLFFHLISIYVYGLTPARNKGMHAFPVPALFLFTQPCPHCTNHALVIFKPCPTQCILQWPKIILGSIPLHSFYVVPCLSMTESQRFGRFAIPFRVPLCFSTWMARVTAAETSSREGKRCPRMDSFNLWNKSKSCQ